MKKCPYCEAKKKIATHRKPDRFFSRCDYCNNFDLMGKRETDDYIQEKFYELAEREAT